MCSEPRKLLRSAAPGLSQQEIGLLWEPVLRQVEECTGAPVTLVVNDVARPSLRPLLEPVESRLAGRVRLLVAVGTHRPVDSQELAALSSDMLADSSQWRCAGWDGYRRLGTTSRGTRLEVDPWLLESGLVVTVGSVEPHYFAGFTGGRKSVLPGCCSRLSAEDNHFLALDPASAPGRLRENPVHLDMVEALQMVAEKTTIIGANAVLAARRVEMLNAGDPVSGFLGAVRFCRASLPRIPREGVACAVLRPGGALELSLYQSMKAIYNWEPALKEEAPVLLDSPCPEGLGAKHMERAFAMAADPGWTISSREEYSLGLHAVGRLRRAFRRLRIHYHGNLDRELVRRLGMQPVDDVEEWVQRHRDLQPVLVPEAATTCPAEEAR